MIITTIWLGLIGFLDDYIKTFRKNKEGLAGRFKIVGQVTIGLIVGLTLYFNDQVVVREVKPATVASIQTFQTEPGARMEYKDTKSTKTTAPLNWMPCMRLIKTSSIKSFATKAILKAALKPIS